MIVGKVSTLAWPTHFAYLNRRTVSSLAERMKRAAAKEGVQESEDEQRMRLEEEVDEQGEQFRELFIQPKRKLGAQLQLERMTGRADPIKFSRFDIHDRLAVRRPRHEEMPVDQDWPSVWPAAASYRSSVVPLPIRMGTRRKPEKRAPFKRVGNLELLKIPNFLHLTPEHIKRHCEAIKKFCTEYPKELLADPSLASKHFPVTVKYSDFLHQGTSLRDPRARVNTIQVDIKSFGFDKYAEDKFRHLVGNRFNEETGMLTIVTDRCYTRKQNRDYADFLLTALYYESQKREQWDNMKDRVDHLKVEFEGSRIESRISQIIKKVAAADGPLPEIAQALKGQPITKEAVVQHQAVREFAETWYTYRNEPETPEKVRSYEDRVRQLLGIKRLSDETENKKL